MIRFGPLSALMNAAPLEYSSARRGASGGRECQEFYGHVIDLAGLRPMLEATDADTGRRIPGWRVWQFSHGSLTYFGLAPDMAVSQDILGGISGEVGDATVRRVQLKLAVAGHVYEARCGRYLGEGDTVADELSATATRLYAVLPYAVSGIELTLTGGEATASLTADGEIGDHVFRFDVLDADGEPILDAGANVPAPGGSAKWQPPLPVPPGGSLRCRDIATGVSTTAS